MSLPTFPPTKGQWLCQKCGYTNHELRIKCRHCANPKHDEVMSGDQVMEELEKVASPAVFAAIKKTYEEEGFPQVVYKDLGLEPVIYYRRTVPKEQAPIYRRKGETGGDSGGTPSSGSPV